MFPGFLPDSVYIIHPRGHKTVTFLKLLNFFIAAKMRIVRKFQTPEQYFKELLWGILDILHTSVYQRH
jgi:hypothetical protein